MLARHSKTFLMSIKFLLLKLTCKNKENVHQAACAKYHTTSAIFYVRRSISLLLTRVGLHFQTGLEQHRPNAGGRSSWHVAEYATLPHFHTFAFSVWIIGKTYVKLLDFNSVHLLLLLQLVLRFGERLLLLLPFCLLTKWKDGDSCYKIWMYTRHVLEDTWSLSNLRYSL